MTSSQPRHGATAGRSANRVACAAPVQTTSSSAGTPRPVVQCSQSKLARVATSQPVSKHTHRQRCRSEPCARALARAGNCASDLFLSVLRAPERGLPFASSVSQNLGNWARSFCAHQHEHT